MRHVSHPPPLYIIYASGESEEVITEVMTFLKTVLPTNAFMAVGQICITDDSDAERAALRKVWPDITFLHFSSLELVVLVVGCLSWHS